jgi:hypothetical protein
VPASRPFVLAVSLEPADASTTIFFGHLHDAAPDVIRVVQHGDAGLPAALAAAGAVVCVRALFELDDVVRAARALRLPLYYFLDDNFVVLNEQGGSDMRWVRRYTADNVRAALRRFTGVLAATPALGEFVADRQLHAQRILFPPVKAAKAVRAAPAPRDRLHIAFFGGAHLHELLLNTIVPAVKRLASQRPVRLITLGAPAIPPSAGLQVEQHPHHVSYERGLATLLASGVDVLVHPSAAHLPNNAYKNPHALITAHALGAVPIVSDAPPYSDLRGQGVARLCSDEHSWYQAMVKVAADPRLRVDIVERLARYCDEHFSGTANRDVLDAILPGPEIRSEAGMLWRRGLAWSCLFTGVTRRSMSRMKHRLAPETGVA